MFLLSTIIVCFVICFIIWAKKDSLIIGIMPFLVTLSCLCVVSAIYISKISYYSFSWDIDYAIYTLLFRRKLHINDISRLYNFFTALFMCCSLFFVRRIANYKKKNVIFFIIPSIIFILINDYTFTNYCFLYPNSNGVDGAELYGKIRLFTIAFNNISTLFYIIFPFIVLAVMFFRSKIFLNRRFYIIAILCLGFIDLFYYLLFVSGSFKLIHPNNLWYNKFPIIWYNNKIEFSQLIVVFVLLCMMISTLIKLRVYYRKNDKPRALKKDEILYENMGRIIHAYKNSFIAIQKQIKLMRIYIQQEKLESAEQCTGLCETLIGEQLRIINDTLGQIKSPYITFEPVSVSKCIRKAVGKVGINEELVFEYDRENMEAVIFGSEDLLTEVFENVILNAIDAIEASEQQYGKIVFKIVSERELCEIDIVDNGCGIEKKNINKIFDLFYSTKSSLLYRGIGLNSVKKSVKLHNGIIRVDSKVGTGTVFRIVFPLIGNSNIITEAE